MQVQLHLHDRYKAVTDKCTKLQKSNDALQVDNAKLNTQVKEEKQKSLALEEELKKMVDCHQSEMKKAQEEHDKVVESLKNRAMTIGAEAVCKTRAELFKEYLSGAHAYWNFKEM